LLQGDAGHEGDLKEDSETRGLSVGVAATPSEGDIEPTMLDRPVVLLGRGGSGTRLLSQLAQDTGIFLGNEINASGDSVEWVQPIYQRAIARCGGTGADLESPQRLRDHARHVLSAADVMKQQLWGWKLPETMLILPDVLAAFPRAKIIHLLRHPVSSSLRRSHMTSRLNNPVGRAVLTAAYREVGRSEKSIERDAEWQHNAITWLYQVRRVAHICRQLGAERWLEVRFEDLCTTPKTVSAQVTAFLRNTSEHLAAAAQLENKIDPARAAGALEMKDPRAAWVWSLCAPVAEQFGYGATPPVGEKS
jgi:hypothetical protein